MNSLATMSDAEFCAVVGKSVNENTASSAKSRRFAVGRTNADE